MDPVIQTGDFLCMVVMVLCGVEIYRYLFMYLCIYLFVCLLVGWLAGWFG